MSMKDLKISNRKLEGYLKYAKIIQWGRRSPIQFMHYFLGIDFLDYQKYVMSMMWNTPFVVLCQSRGSGKSTLSAPFLMAKCLLIPNFNSYIISTNGSQAC